MCAPARGMRRQCGSALPGSTRCSGRAARCATRSCCVSLIRNAAGLIAALVVGDQAAIDRADWDVFRATGVAHLMSISGLHITMFAWAAALALGWLWRRSAWLCLRLPAPSAALLGGMALATAYALFSGWGVPAQRTVLMLATRRRLAPAGRALALAAGLVAGLRGGGGGGPVGAVAGRFLAEFCGGGRAVCHRCRCLAGISSSARQKPLLDLDAGAVDDHAGAHAPEFAAVWPGLAGGFAGQCAGHSVGHAGGDAAGHAGRAAAPAVGSGRLGHGLLAQLLRGLAQWPWASVSLAQAPWWAGVAGVLGGLLLALRLPWPLRLGGVPLLLPLLFWQAPPIPAGEFELLAADMGQGNAVLVRTAHHALLYDAGPQYSRESDAGHRVLVPLAAGAGGAVGHPGAEPPRQRPHRRRHCGADHAAAGGLDKLDRG